MSLLKTTGGRERLSLNTVKRLSVFSKVADVPPKASIAIRKNVIPSFKQLLTSSQFFRSYAASRSLTAFVAE